MGRLVLGLVLLSLVRPVNVRPLQGILTTSSTIVTITGPTAGTTYDAGISATLTTLAGTAQANKPVSACTWTNSLGGSGSATGTSTWSVSSIALTVGSNVITVTCPNAGGTGTDVITVTRTAATCDQTAASASRANVVSAIAAATAGQTVCVPAGSATWGTPIDINTSVVIKGAGIGVTTITSSIVGTFDACASALFCVDPTTSASNPAVRITGFTFDGNWTSGCVALLNTPYSTSTAVTRVRVDHNRFVNCGKVGTTQRALMVDGLTFGVIDNNVFENNQKTIDFELSDAYGWAIAADPGGANSMYFEDNSITNTDSRVSILTSGGQGGRYVWRFNTANTADADADNQHLDMHGTLSDRGTVIGEVYYNVLTTKTGAYQFMDHRGGIGRFFLNRVIKPSSDIQIAIREEDGVSYPAQDQITLSYYWQNTYGPSTGLEGNFDTPDETEDSCMCLTVNRDYWVYTASFTGATGMGVGVRSSRPATCTTGVAYWSTDQGEWNSTNGATADGTLDRCTATNTWTNGYYTPYTYPHPLRSDSVLGG